MPKPISNPNKDSNEFESMVCSKCSKPIRASRASLTAWIFRPASCTCQSAKGATGNAKGTALRDTPAESPKTTTPIIDDESLELASRKPTSPEKSLIGKVIKQKYQITDFIGRGGMSVVYKARDLLLDKEVAIKVLNANLATDENSIKRFKIEAQAVSALNSKNIVKLYDFDMTEDRQPFLAVELLVGSSLADVLKNWPDGVPADVATGWFCQIASALEEAHYQGVIHRDIKPSNIAINRDSVKIFDFGIAKVFFGENGSQSKMTQTGEIFGSPLYMSPEQCRGERLNGRSDIYSFGTLMYEVISGKPPFYGHSMLDAMAKQISARPKPLRDLIPNISDGLEYVIMRCLEKDQALRYQTARDLLIDLEHVQAHRKIPNMMRRNVSQASGQITARALKMPDRSIKENLKMAVVVVGFFYLVGFVATTWFTWSPTLKNPLPGAASVSTDPKTERYDTIRTTAYQYFKAKRYTEAANLLNFLINAGSSNEDKSTLGQLLGYCYHRTGNLLPAYYEYQKWGVYPGDKVKFISDFKLEMQKADSKVVPFSMSELRLDLLKEGKPAGPGTRTQ